MRRRLDHFLDVDQRGRFDACSAAVRWTFRLKRFGSTRRLFFFLAVAAVARFLAAVENMRLLPCRLRTPAGRQTSISSVGGAVVVDVGGDIHVLIFVLNFRTRAR